MQKYGQQNFTAKPHRVKANIVASGIKLGDLAKRSGFSQPSLTQYIKGNRRKMDGQVSIWKAFCDLSSSEETLQEFWGEILSKKVVGWPREPKS